MCNHSNTIDSMSFNNEPVDLCVDCGVYIMGDTVMNVSTGSKIVMLG